MVQILKSLSLTLFFIICEFESIIAYINMTKENGIEDPNFIQLTNFHRPILINQKEIDHSFPYMTYQCQGYCNDINTTTNVHPHTFKGQENFMSCNGWLHDCLLFDNLYRAEGFVQPKYCHSEDGRIIWAEDSNAFTYGDKNTQEKCTEKATPFKQTDEFGGACFTCMCTCTEWPNGDEAKTWAFSLEPQESNVRRNRVVVGVRFRRYDKMIYLEIKEGKIGSDRHGKWKSSHQRSYNLIRNVDYSPLKPDSRSVKLDKIFVPPHYVVTGVRFSVARTTSVKGQNFILHLEVQGTKFNRVTRKLMKHTSTWYNFKNSAKLSRNHGNYGLKSSTVEDDGYIVFHNNDLHSSDLGYYTFPYLSTANVKSKTNRFLKGIGLSYIDQGTKAGYILPEIFRRKAQLKPNEYIVNRV